jgi:hypothetical protein
MWFIMVHTGFMSNRTKEIKDRLKQFEKNNLALRKTIAKRLDRLDASQNALRGVEEAIGGKLVEKSRSRVSQRPC